MRRGHVGIVRRRASLKRASVGPPEIVTLIRHQAASQEHDTRSAAVREDDLGDAHAERFRRGSGPREAARDRFPAQRGKKK